MPVIVTVLARVKDWQTFRKLSNHIVVKAQAIRASRYQTYRNAHDASLALLFIELPEPDDACEMRETLVEQFDALPNVQLADDRIWEPTGWKALGVKERRPRPKIEK